MNGLRILLAAALLIGAGAEPQPPATEAQQPKTTPPAWVEHGSLLLEFGIQPVFRSGDVGPLLSGHIAMHFGSTQGLSLMGSYAKTPQNCEKDEIRCSLVEQSLFLSVGYRWGIEYGVWRFYVGPELGAGFLVHGSEHTAADLAVGPYGSSLKLHRHVFLTVEGHVAFAFGPWDSRSNAAILPAAWIGISFAF